MTPQNDEDESDIVRLCALGKLDVNPDWVNRELFLKRESWQPRKKRSELDPQRAERWHRLARLYDPSGRYPETPRDTEEEK